MGSLRMDMGKPNKTVKEELTTSHSFRIGAHSAVFLDLFVTMIATVE